jgi:hypothetical protein
VHKPDPKTGVERSTRLAIKRDKLLNVAALSDHTLGKKGKGVRNIVICGTGEKGGRQNEQQASQEREHLQGNGGEKAV